MISCHKSISVISLQKWSYSTISKQPTFRKDSKNAETQQLIPQIYVHESITFGDSEAETNRQIKQASK